MVVIDLRFACHHLKCNFLNKRLRAVTFPERIALRVLPTSKDTQSEGLGGPVACSS